MAYVPEFRRPSFSRFVLEYLDLQPGPVHDVLLVSVPFCYEPEAIFHALHTVKSLVSASITYIVSCEWEAQVLVRCSNPDDTERLDTARVMFKFDDKVIQLTKLVSVSLKPDAEDFLFNCNVREFFACSEGLHEVGYPRGFTDEMEDINQHLNPTMSATTMHTLGVQEGKGDRLLKVDIKYLGRPRDFLYALYVAKFPGAKFAVDQDGSLYMKFQTTLESAMISIYHILVRRYTMIKFYKVVSVKKRNAYFDDSLKTIYSRASREDVWQPVQ